MNNVKKLVASLLTGAAMLSLSSCAGHLEIQFGPGYAGNTNETSASAVISADTTADRGSKTESPETPTVQTPSNDIVRADDILAELSGENAEYLDRIYGFWKDVAEKGTAVGECIPDEAELKEKLDRLQDMWKDAITVKKFEIDEETVAAIREKAEAMSAYWNAFYAYINGESDEIPAENAEWWPDAKAAFENMKSSAEALEKEISSAVNDFMEENRESIEALRTLLEDLAKKADEKIKERFGRYFN